MPHANGEGTCHAVRLESRSVMVGFREKIRQNQRQHVGEAPTASHQLTRMNEKIVSSPAASHAGGAGGCMHVQRAAWPDAQLMRPAFSSMIFSSRTGVYWICLITAPSRPWGPCTRVHKGKGSDHCQSRRTHLPENSSFVLVTSSRKPVQLPPAGGLVVDRGPGRGGAGRGGLATVRTKSTIERGRNMLSNKRMPPVMQRQLTTA